MTYRHVSSSSHGMNVYEYVYESCICKVIAAEERDLQECTFKPAVRQPTKDMHVALEYLSEPAWLRLSRPRPVTPQQSADMAQLPGGRRDKYLAEEELAKVRATMDIQKTDLETVRKTKARLETELQAADAKVSKLNKLLLDMEAQHAAPSPGKAGNKSGAGGGGPGASPRDKQEEEAKQKAADEAKKAQGKTETAEEQRKSVEAKRQQEEDERNWKKFEELENERQKLEALPRPVGPADDKSQVDRYKCVLIKQRDIMIALTSRCVCVRERERERARESVCVLSHTHTHTHTYKLMCVCVSVRVCVFVCIG